MAIPCRTTSRRAYYRGLNTLVLWCEHKRMGYHSHLWGTYRQWAALGTEDKSVDVRKGEKGKP